MRIVTSTGSMQRMALKWKRAGVRVGLVPTMGYLHAGHLSLVKEARRRVGPRGRVVLSIYVNPTQFGPNEDFSRYPRDFQRDTRQCREAGVDVVFAPDNEQMYPGTGPGAFSSFVNEELVSRDMEGRIRPGHFRGVTTVVAKLFNIVLPDVAVFGGKDLQQASVIRRMVRDLNFPLKLVVAPTLREADGLAMSSRNKYLQGAHRTDALVLWKSLQAVRAKVRKSAKPVSAKTLAALVNKLVSAHGGSLDYVAFFDPETLEPVKQAGRGTQMALAVRIGSTRLIDNARL